MVSARAIKVQRARLAGGPERTSKLPLGMERRIRNEASLTVTETDKDKEGTITGAGDAKDEMERPEAAGLWWERTKQMDRRNEATQQERQMKSTGDSSGTTSRGVGRTT